MKYAKGVNAMSEVKSASEQPKTGKWRAQKNIKQLRSSIAVSAHQKEWFQRTIERISAG